MKNIFIISKIKDNIIEPDIFSIKDLVIQTLSKDIENIWKPVNLNWYDGICEPKYDFIFIYGYIPVCNEIAYRLLSQLDVLYNIYFLPIIIDNSNYYIMSVLHNENSVLNENKSKIKYFSDKSILRIEEYVFNKVEPKSALFKIPQSITTFFATEDFVSYVKLNNLSGINFIECKIANQHFWNKLF